MTTQRTVVSVPSWSRIERFQSSKLGEITGRSESSAKDQYPPCRPLGAVGDRRTPGVISLKGASANHIRDIVCQSLAAIEESRRLGRF
jgi:hypothetical protein